MPNNNEGGDDDDDDNDEQKERKTINVATLTKFAPNFFPILFAGYEQTNAQEFLNVIKTYVVFASKELIENMGNQVIKKLIQSTINLSENHATASLMLGLATVLTPKLSVKQRDVLYKASNKRILEGRLAHNEAIHMFFPSLLVRVGLTAPRI